MFQLLPITRASEQRMQQQGSLEAALNRRYRPLKDAEPQLWLSHYHKWGHLHGGLRDYHLGWLYLGKCQRESIWMEIAGPDSARRTLVLVDTDLAVLTDKNGRCFAGSMNPRHLWGWI